MKNLLKFELTALVLVIISCAVLLAPAKLYAYETDDENIHFLQSILAMKGIYSGPIDGIAGPETKKAIRLYKKQIGWRVNDQISDLLIEILREEVKLVSQHTNPEPESPNNSSSLLDSTPTTRDMVYSVTQSARMATNTADSVMKTYESYFTAMSRVAAGVLGILTMLGVAGFWAYLKPILTVRKEHEKALKDIETQQTKIDELSNNAHANISALLASCSASANLNTFIYFGKAKILDQSSANELLIGTDKILSRALEYKPKDTRILASIYGMQGIIFRETDRKSESCETFKKAIEIDPANTSTLCNAACSFALEDRTDEALSYLNEAVKLQPTLCTWAKNEKMLDKIRNDARFPC